MDELAQRAGVGKATIYRRWTSKESLVLDALHTATTPIPTPDEGDLRSDLITYTDALIERFGAGRGSDVDDGRSKMRSRNVSAMRTYGQNSSPVA